MTTDRTWTVNDIQTAVRAAGSHWFDPDTMRSFGTRVLPSVYQGDGGVFFVTSEKQFDGTRGYTVRRFTPDGASIHTVGELAGYPTAQEARTAARVEARGEGKAPVQTTAEEFRPVTVLEQFLSDLRAHGKRTASEDIARELIRLAGKYHRLMEQFCNGFQTPRMEALAEKRREEFETAILDIANRVGASAAMFSGDPRGATVKLRFADGATNDFGGKGWIVPTSERDESDD